MLILETERTILTPLKEEDFQAIISMYLEPDSNKFIPPLQNKSAEEYQAFLQKRILKNNHPKGHGVWVIRTKETQEFIGTANLNILEALQLTHLGAHLAQAAWGKGYATEVLSTVSHYGLQTLELSAIHALVDEQNQASKNMLVKIGMSYFETIELFGVQVMLYRF
jgi:RimJ/RimL family protein N-acetyltransferase